MKQSPFRMGWVLVMFDLPVVADAERKAASRFRHSLLDEGYLMIQFSVYARPCVSFEALEKHTKRLEKMCPEAGNVRILFMTDEQWKRSKTVIGKNYSQGKRAVDPDIPQQIEFWE